MALNRLGGFSSGYDAYNIPSAKDKIQVNDAAAAQTRSQEQQTPAQEEKKQDFDLSVEVSPRENASIENVAISFGQYDNSSLDLFGEMGLASRDMKQAISGMQKDRILHEYQYFVGAKDLTGQVNNNIISGTNDGVVIKLQ